MIEPPMYHWGMALGGFIVRGSACPEPRRLSFVAPGCETGEFVFPIQQLTAMGNSLAILGDSASLLQVLFQTCIAGRGPLFGESKGLSESDMQMHLSAVRREFNTKESYLGSETEFVPANVRDRAIEITSPSSSSSA